MGTSNKDYAKFFDKCVKGKITIKKYQPQQERITNIVVYANNAGIFNYGYFIDGYNVNKVYFTKELLKLISKVMKEKDYDRLDYCFNYLISLGLSPYDVLRFSKLFMYNDKAYDDIIEYYRAIRSACSNFEHLGTKIEPNDVRIIQLIKILNKYCPKWSPDYCDNRRNAFVLYGYHLLGDFNLTDLDTSYLDKLFQKALLNNTAEFLKRYSKAGPSSYDSYPIDLIKEMVLADCCENKKEIR